MSSAAVAEPEPATATRPPTNRVASRSKSARTSSARTSSARDASSARTASARPQQQPEPEMEAAMDEENQPGVDRIEQLADLAIGAADIKKMKDAGFYTVTSILMRTKKQLMQVKGLSEPKVDKIRDAAIKLSGVGFVSGLEARNRRASVIHISTGSEALNEILGGGVETCSLTEAYGEFRCGKTQLSHTLCVTAQLPQDDGGGDGRVAFIDTENTFRPERVVEICERYELAADEVLDNIIVARAYTSEMQIELLEHVAMQMSISRFALLIVDSATGLFRVDFTGRGELSMRQQKLNAFMSGLMKIAEQFGVAVFLTNQVQAVPDSMSFGPDKKPIGGHVMAHASTTRLALRKGRGDQRICKVMDSPMMPEAEATFMIGAGGVADATD